jgi:hypothetical protein
MIINLRQSTLFTSDPIKRFDEQYGVNIWGDIWKRYKNLEYTTQDICDLYLIRTGERIKTQTIRRWIWRTEVYFMAKPILDKGASCVRSSIFGKKEGEVLKELLKNISEHPKNKILP